MTLYLLLKHVHKSVAMIMLVLVALAAGTVVTALVVIALKRWVGRKELEAAEAPFEAVAA